MNYDQRHKLGKQRRVKFTQKVTTAKGVQETRKAATGKEAKEHIVYCTRCNFALLL